MRSSIYWLVLLAYALHVYGIAVSNHKVELIGFGMLIASIALSLQDISTKLKSE